MGVIAPWATSDRWTVIGYVPMSSVGTHAAAWALVDEEEVASVGRLSALLPICVWCQFYLTLDVSGIFFLFLDFRKKTATACAFAKQGRGLIKVNGQPIELIEPESLRLKAFEPVLVLGQDKFANLDIRIRVKGGGMTAQIYAIRAAIAKAIVAYHAKYVDESSKNELRKTLMAYDRNLLVADPRRCEPKKYGGRSARTRFQKSYR